jgi:hypothetical protein
VNRWASGTLNWRPRLMVADTHCRSRGRCDFTPPHRQSDQREEHEGKHGPRRRHLHSPTREVPPPAPAQAPPLPNRPEWSEEPSSKAQDTEERRSLLGSSPSIPLRSLRVRACRGLC